MFKKIFTIAWLSTLLTFSQFALAAPSVNVTATPNTATAPANITLSVTVTPDGDPVTITQVEYLLGTSSLGHALEAPYSLTLNGLAAGTYAVIAKVSTTDPANPVLESPPAQVTIAVPAGAAQAYFIHSDQLNTPRSITNSDGSEVWRWDSDPFGKDSANEQPAGQSPFVFNQRFPGQYFDKETNLQYNYFRDYDSQIGRYIQSDPVGLAGGVNTYGYVEGNPVANVDPTGQIAIPATGVVVAGISAAIWWSSNHPTVPAGQSKPEGIIPPQDFPNGISWPPKDDPKECRIELPPPKLPPPQKPDCETIFQVCRKAVAQSASNVALRIMGDFSCLSAYAICKKVKDH